MAKYKTRLEARVLRSQGKSITAIAKKLNVSKGSVSWWVRDIVLTSEQLQQLRDNEIKGHEIGRLKTIRIMEEKRFKRIERAKQLGIKMLTTLTKKELLVTGLALYWAEGGKSSSNKRVEFCNSDPKMIKLLMLWLKQCLGVKLEDLRVVVGINQIHKIREGKVKEYWSMVTGIPLDQFRKTSFKQVKNTKIYDNFENHYGTLSVLVTKSTGRYYKIMGLIEGLSAQITK